MVFTYKVEDIAATILRFAREYRVGHIVLGSPAPIPFWRRITGRKSILERLMEESGGMTIVILDTRSYRPVASQTSKATQKGSAHEVDKTPSPSTSVNNQPFLSSFLDTDRIVLWRDPVDRESVLETLVRVACRDNGLMFIWLTRTFMIKDEIEAR